MKKREARLVCLTDGVLVGNREMPSFVGTKDVACASTRDTESNRRDRGCKPI